MSSDGTGAGKNNRDGAALRSAQDLLPFLHTAPGSCSHVRTAATVHTLTHSRLTGSTERLVCSQAGTRLVPRSLPNETRCFNPICLSGVLSEVVDSSTLRGQQAQS